MEAARYFGATVMGRRLFVEGIPDWGPWDPARLHVLPEALVDIAIAPHPKDRKVHTTEQLDRVLASVDALPAVRVWIHIDLIDVAHDRWEQTSRRGGTETPR